MVEHRNWIASSLFALIVLTIVIQGGNGLSCFQCNSYNQKGCADLTKEDINSQYYKPCPDSMDGVFCRKTHLKVLVKEMAGDPHDRIIRSCAHVIHPRKPCYDTVSASHNERVCHCSDDGCNHASVMFKMPIIWTLVSSLILRLVLT